MPLAVPKGPSPKYAFAVMEAFVSAETPTRFMKPASPDVARQVCFGADGTPTNVFDQAFVA